MHSTNVQISWHQLVMTGFVLTWPGQHISPCHLSMRRWILWPLWWDILIRNPPSSPMGHLWGAHVLLECYPLLCAVRQRIHVERYFQLAVVMICLFDGSGLMSVNGLLLCFLACLAAGEHLRWSTLPWCFWTCFCPAGGNLCWSILSAFIYVHSLFAKE